MSFFLPLVISLFGGPFGFILRGAILAQTPEDGIRSAIEKVEQGNVDEVKRAMPDLMAKYQNTPGLLYLEGRVAADGIEAVKFYQSVVDNFPKSEWAADALYRIYQYYYALGLYKTAELKLDQLRKEYPSSPRVIATGGGKLPKQEEAAVNLPAAKDTAVADTPRAAQADSDLTAGNSGAGLPPEQRETGPQQASPPPSSSSSASGNYTLQAGAFSTLANAEKQKDFFEELGYQAEITNKVRAGRSFHLVWVGSFRSADEAMRFGREMKSKYKIESIVVERY